MGRKIVVTGGSGALGRAVVAKLLASEVDAKVIVPIFDVQEAIAAGYIDGAGAPVLPKERLMLVSHELSMDMRDEERVVGFYEMLGPIDASVHILGGFRMNAIEATAASEVRAMFEMNAMTAFLSCREAARNMPNGGHLLNVIARPVLVPSAHMTAYAMSKAAVAALTTTLAEELKARRIWVNAIAPSIIDTPANRAAMPDAQHAIWPTTAQLADVVTFLISQQNQVVSGALVPVYGQA